MKLISRISPLHLGHVGENSSPTRASSFAKAIRDVSWNTFHQWFQPNRSSRYSR
jgi:hypothetical protein